MNPIIQQFQKLPNEIIGTISEMLYQTNKNSLFSLSLSCKKCSQIIRHYFINQIMSHCLTSDYEKISLNKKIEFINEMVTNEKTNKLSQYGNLPLFLAIEGNNKELVDLFSKNLKKGLIKSVLRACHHNHEEIVVLLLKNNEKSINDIYNFFLQKTPSSINGKAICEVDCLKIKRTFFTIIKSGPFIFSSKNLHVFESTINKIFHKLLLTYCQSGKKDELSYLLKSFEEISITDPMVSYHAACNENINNNLEIFELLANDKRFPIDNNHLQKLLASILAAKIHEKKYEEALQFFSSKKIKLDELCYPLHHKALDVSNLNYGFSFAEDVNKKFVFLNAFIEQNKTAVNWFYLKETIFEILNEQKHYRNLSIENFTFLTKTAIELLTIDNDFLSSEIYNYSCIVIECVYDRVLYQQLSFAKTTTFSARWEILICNYLMMTPKTNLDYDHHGNKISCLRKLMTIAIDCKQDEILDMILQDKQLMNEPVIQTLLKEHSLSSTCDESIKETISTALQSSNINASTNSTRATQASSTASKKRLIKKIKNLVIKKK